MPQTCKTLRNGLTLCHVEPRISIITEKPCIFTSSLQQQRKPTVLLLYKFTGTGLFLMQKQQNKKTTEYYKATCHNCHLCANVLPDDNNLLILPFLTCHSAITGITSFCAVATVFNNLLYPIISFSFAPFTSFIGTLSLIVICSLFQTLVS